MSDVFFRDLGIPDPEENLAVGSGSHGWQTGHMLERLERSLQAHKPDWVLVYGDTNSTLAAAIAAVKSHLPLAHLEAGLRSFNRRMPEEHNRVLTDHASDLLLAPTNVAMVNLNSEGIGGRAVLVGDVMTDVCLATKKEVLASHPTMPEGWSDDSKHLVATIHRQENTDDEQRLRLILSYLSSANVPVRLLAHPRLRSKAAGFGIQLEMTNISVFDPLSYPQLVYAVVRSSGVVTDSGGLQKEAFLLERPCITLRTETEWPETVELGWNLLDPNCTRNPSELLQGMAPRDHQSPYGTGSSAPAAVRAIENYSL
jgi:UDP-N-acetylglucosamine 2-epimerase (non-hydrolysing)